MDRIKAEQALQPLESIRQESVDQLVEDLQGMVGNWLNQYRRAISAEADDNSIVRFDSTDSKRMRKPIGVSLDKWAHEAYAERRLRDEIFEEPSIFGEPAWDLLLDIATAEASGKRLQISSACIGSCVPPTTALRWISILEKKGLIRRESDWADARRNFLRLTHEGAEKIERYFERIAARRNSWPGRLISS